MKAIISDFDGTLFDTRDANFLAYQDAFVSVGLRLDRADYTRLYGLRFDMLMDNLNVLPQFREQIKKTKAIQYAMYVKQGYVKPNKNLLDFIESEHNNGIKTAIASTARLENMKTILDYFGKNDLFDVIVSGEDVEHGKPLPDVYIKALTKLHITADDAIAFEDTNIGVTAANHAGIKCIKITTE